MTIKAHPGARKNEIQVDTDGQVRVSVTQTAQRGKANEALVVLLAKKLRVAKSRIEVLRGATGRQKTLLLRDGQLDDIRRQLAADE